MAHAFVIETLYFTAGIIAAQDSGFRFYASHPAMAPLEGKIFRSPNAAQTAAEKLAADAETAQVLGPVDVTVAEPRCGPDGVDGRSKATLVPKGTGKPKRRSRYPVRTQP